MILLRRDLVGLTYKEFSSRLSYHPVITIWLLDSVVYSRLYTRTEMMFNSQLWYKTTTMTMTMLLLLLVMVMMMMTLPEACRCRRFFTQWTVISRMSAFSNFDRYELYTPLQCATRTQMIQLFNFNGFRRFLHCFNLLSTKWSYPNLKKFGTEVVGHHFQGQKVKGQLVPDVLYSQHAGTALPPSE